MPRLLPHTDLAIRARPFANDRLEVPDLSARAERIHDVIDELQELDREILHRYLDLFAEVDELRIHAAPHCAPLVLLDQARQVQAKALILLAKYEQLRADRLDERGEAERLVDACRRVTHPELDGREERVRTKVPPDLAAVVYR